MTKPPRSIPCADSLSKRNGAGHSVRARSFVHGMGFYKFDLDSTKPSPLAPSPVMMAAEPNYGRIAQSTADPTWRSLRGAGLGWAGIDQVVLAGGSTLLPAVASGLRRAS
jgi:hypothetical protein